MKFTLGDVFFYLVLFAVYAVATMWLGMWCLALHWTAGAAVSFVLCGVCFAVFLFCVWVLWHSCIGLSPSVQ